MFWRFGERGADSQGPPLLYDDVCHRLRGPSGPWVRVPYHSALILSLLLRMHALRRTVTPRELCAFLHLPERTRISGYVTDLRKTIAECGVDPDRVLEPIKGQKNVGYRLAEGAVADAVAPADELQLIERTLTHPEVTPGLREELKQLYAMLALSAAVAIGFTTWSLLKPDAPAPPIARHDPEEGSLARTLVPGPAVRAFVSPLEGGSLERTQDGYAATLRRDPNTDAPAEACFELEAELGLRERDVLAVGLTLLAPSAATRIAISVEQVPPQRIASLAFDVPPRADATLRIPAKHIAPELRARGRTICIGEDEELPGSATGTVAIKLRAVWVE